MVYLLWRIRSDMGIFLPLLDIRYSIHKDFLIGHLVFINFWYCSQIQYYIWDTMMIPLNKNIRCCREVRADMSVLERVAYT